MTIDLSDMESLESKEQVDKGDIMMCKDTIF